MNTQTQLHAHMRRRPCIPKGGDLTCPQAGGTSKAGDGQVFASDPPQPPGSGCILCEVCLFFEVLFLSTQTLKQICESWVLQACAAGYGCGQPVCWLQGPVSPLQGSREWGCRRDEGGRQRGPLPRPRGPGLREGGGDFLISQPPWQGGPWVPRQPVGGPGAASLTPGKGVPESTGAAAAAGGAVGPPGGEATVGQPGARKLLVVVCGKCGRGEVAVAAMGLLLPPL